MGRDTVREVFSPYTDFAPGKLIPQVAIAHLCSRNYDTAFHAECRLKYKDHSDAGNLEDQYKAAVQ